MDGLSCGGILLGKAEAVNGKVFTAERIIKLKLHLLACKGSKTEAELVPVRTSIAIVLRPVEGVEQRCGFVVLRVDDIKGPLTVNQERSLEVSIKLYVAAFLNGELRTGELRSAVVLRVVSD